MVAAREDKIWLKNAAASIRVDLFGGAITLFQLKGHQVNPLNFKFSKKQMPANNRDGAPYQGHFLCLGRWGKASRGERKAGMPDHGQPANIQWSRFPSHSTLAIEMGAHAFLEGLQVNRRITMDETNALYVVEENVINRGPLGRLYNMVQHPTLTAPFLDDAVSVHCNGATGFDQFTGPSSESRLIHWPNARDPEGHLFNLESPKVPYNTIFSFIVNPDNDHGWICAYSSQCKLLIGYIWKRIDYPWIHLWQHWQHGRIKCRGLEFGAAGLHQPFDHIFKSGPYLLGEKAFDYIDAGEMKQRKYLSFLCNLDINAGKIKEIGVQNNPGRIVIRTKDKEYDIRSGFKKLL